MKKTIASIVMLLSACSFCKSAEVEQAASPTITVAPMEAPIAAPAPEHKACPDDMQLVSGNYCSQVKQVCEVWKDDPSVDGARCQRYKPSTCIAKLVPMAFCMDIDEYTEPGEALPTVNVDAYQAKAFCAKEGKRLCKEDEFNFACEGEQMFPYTTGLERPDGICNIDIGKPFLGRVGHLNDLRQPSKSLVDCVSPFGIRNMNGNVGEVVIRNVSSGQYSIALKSGWWAPVRDRCRPATVAHSELYSGAESGLRCCNDVQ
jgi:formylglycine-generating enzyme required for sulfatase activity